MRVAPLASKMSRQTVSVDVPTSPGRPRTDSDASHRGGAALKLSNMIKTFGKLSMWLIIGSALLVLGAAALI